MLIRASLLDAPTQDAARFVRDGAVVVDPKSGTIVASGAYRDISQKFPHEPELPAADGTRPILLPGLIDVHAHLPQYPAVARTEESLLPWLERHIFPLEREFRSGEQRAFIEAFFDDVAANGTTTIVLYSAIWEETTDLAFEVAQAKGIRAVIGKVMMDEGSYGTQQPTVAREKSLTQTRRLIEKWHRANNGLLDYAMSPRFAVTCSMELMQQAATMAREFDTYIQTHLSENQGEINAVAERFPEASSYTDVYREAGLLTPKTILGHCIHLSPDELQLIAAHDARVAHCPTSNFFLNSGLYPLDQVDRAGILTALASDVAGGPELNLWQVMRSAIEVQKARSFTDDSVPHLTAAHALYLSTAGAAKVLHKDDAIGTLDSGKDADLTLIDLNRVLPLGGKFSPDEISAEQVLSALIYRGTPTATLATFVRGRQIYG